MKLYISLLKIHQNTKILVSAVKPNFKIFYYSYSAFYKINPH